jgi:arylsulfatase A-like enzyme
MPRKPNILFVTADQLRKDALGCYRNAAVRTPNVDAIARRGVRLERVFTAYPVCAPNRASIVTGRMPTVHSLTENGRRLPKTELTLMEALRRAGYHTYGSGKMHFGPQWPFPPPGKTTSDPDPGTAFDPQPRETEFPWYGFDRAILTEDHRTGPYGRYLAEHGYDVWDELHSASFPQSATVRSAFPEEHHQTTWITDRALDFLAEHYSGGVSEAPFFLWVSYVHPHHPFNPPAPYDTMYRPRDMPLPVWEEGEEERWPAAYREKYLATGTGHEAVGLCRFSDDDWRRIKAYYYGMVTQIDRNFGRLVEMLARRGALDDTIVVFTSDHGENLGDHHLLFKGTTYDCVTNVPFLAAGPGIPDRGEARELLASSIDIMPTLLEMAGVPPADPDPVQGQSLVRAFGDPEIVLRDELLIENAGVRRTIRTPTQLLTWHGEGVRGELYDLEADPHCLSNLWEEPSRLSERVALLERLLRLMAENVDPLPVREGVW